ncbi:hypothetical protein Ocin01_00639 [Orchesella cincta]|uniref:Uncharacterized protein n=1 Tax=Orchesella cincta TaxID=48709 RepID=A0A1D2NLD6_ORCCI|nr:hypothetical protein Ocin01_00639 [Orchesella cincta]
MERKSRRGQPTGAAIFRAEDSEDPLASETEDSSQQSQLSEGQASSRRRSSRLGGGTLTTASSGVTSQRDGGKRKQCLLISDDSLSKKRVKKPKSGSTRTLAEGRGREMSSQVPVSDSEAIGSGDFSRSGDSEDPPSSSSCLGSHEVELVGRGGTAVEISQQSGNCPHLILSPYADKAPARRVVTKKMKTKQAKNFKSVAEEATSSSSSGSQNIDVVTRNLETTPMKASDSIQDDAIPNIKAVVGNDDSRMEQNNMAGNSEALQNEDEDDEFVDSLEGTQESEDETVDRHETDDDETKTEELHKANDITSNGEEDDDMPDSDTDTVGICNDEKVSKEEQGEETSNQSNGGNSEPDETPNVDRDEDEPDGPDIIHFISFGCRIS